MRMKRENVVTSGSLMTSAGNSFRVDDTPRAMWILNHTAARKFELPMLHKLGYEIFTPKKYPNDPNFRSASVDAKWDQTLSIPEADLDLLNSTDWYNGANLNAWSVANKYFDILFCIVFNARGIQKTCSNFAGDILWRTYGLAEEAGSYSRIITEFHQYSRAHYAFKKKGDRFWFAEAYPHLHEIEDSWIKKRAVYLPLGMAGASEQPQPGWTGGDRRVLFVCPDIGHNTAYSEIYHQFKQHLGDLPYAVGGTQSVKINDPNVLGYLPLEKHRENMAHMQCMFYHSRESRHIHYHPFEAIKIGMPLVFMSDGMLDRMGGLRLPGRARTWGEAKSKIGRILDGDKDFIQDVTTSQSILLESMKAENLESSWAEGLSRITRSAQLRVDRSSTRRLKFAILAEPKDLPKARSLARDVTQDAAHKGMHVNVVVGLQVGDADLYDSSFKYRAKDDEAQQRAFNWRKISGAAAKRAMFYARSAREIVSETYVVPDDEISYFQDCDAWVIIGGRAEVPVLPLKPLIWFLPESHQNNFHLPKSNTWHLGRLGQPPHPEAVVVETAKLKSIVINLEGLDPKDIAVLDPTKQQGCTLFDMVLECI